MKRLEILHITGGQSWGHEWNIQNWQPNSQSRNGGGLYGSYSWKRGTIITKSIERIENPANFLQTQRRDGLHSGGAQCRKKLKLWNSFVLAKATYGVPLVPLTKSVIRGLGRYGARNDYNYIRVFLTKMSPLSVVQKLVNEASCHFIIGGNRTQRPLKS